MAHAEKFYTPILATLGWRRLLSEASPDKLLWRPAVGTRPLFGIMLPFDGAPQQAGNGAMTALNAPDRATVDAVYDLAMALGGTSEGRPGHRPHYHAHYYGAYFRDLDGNKLCVVCHAPTSAPEAVRLSEAAMHDHALAWISAWNRRDVEAVLAGFHPDATFRSPVAEKILGSDQILGVRALRNYWDAALTRIAKLQFTLLNVVCDESRQTMVVLYLAEMDGKITRACELFAFHDGRKIGGEALYGCWL